MPTQIAEGPRRQLSRLLHPVRRETNTYKILFSGPVGAGKTTAITTLSDEPPVSTDEFASDETADRKETTTVALDYGVMRLSVKDQLHLYGTPGQERFDFMWEILRAGALGLIILVDNAADDPLTDLRYFVGAYRDFIADTAVVVGVTRTDVRSRPTLDDHYQVVESLGVTSPIFTVDARRRADVALLVETLLFTLEPELSVS